MLPRSAVVRLLRTHCCDTRTISGEIACQAEGVFEELLDANQHYVDSFDLVHLTNRSLKSLVIVTCMDVRIDPLSVFGLKIGDINVLRNAAARVTPDVIRSLTLATTLLGATHIIVLHHTACALSGVSNDQVRAAIADLGTIVDPSLDFYAMPDTNAALATDVEAVVKAPSLPVGIVVAGWLYDTDTGTVTEVVPGCEKTR